MRRQISLLMLAGVVVGLSALSALSALSESPSDQDNACPCSDKAVPFLPAALLEKAREQAVIDGDATRKVMDTARELAKTMTLAENIHKEAGIQAAQKSNADFRKPEFQRKMAAELTRQTDLFLPENGRAKQQEQAEKGIFTETEKVYLFLSSSIPEASFQGYMASLEDVPEIVPVMRGMVGGLNREHREERVQWWSKVLQKDTACEKRPEKPCELIKPTIPIKPALFKQYSVTEVPALIYDRGDMFFHIQGDVGLVSLLEKVNQEAKSPGVTAVITKIRGSR
ncbi:TrbC family F-type conjugative pilus assembly protein [Desulforhopalus sp. IMCC35007]|uniref:TrbC family F-type conjugative pilus assembly protein n=1 Tax=Desulforhopalus sp. IMCC35007 TaxID=2569543 RepID=UPI00145EB36F|nr:TrbC family F-type conjugative pilus assembly protein [Desulforhopalus sp. IMCC35007]